MKLPKPSPAFCRAYGIARALAFPGLYLSTESYTEPPPHSPNFIDIQMAGLACEIMSWDDAKVEDFVIQARAEFLAENASQIAAIRKALQEQKEAPKVKEPKFAELASKITISL